MKFKKEIKIVEVRADKRGLKTADKRERAETENLLQINNVFFLSFPKGCEGEYLYKSITDFLNPTWDFNPILQFAKPFLDF